jgi:hypothetical protein
MNVRDMPLEVMVWFESPALSVPGGRQRRHPHPAIGLVESHPDQLARLQALEAAADRGLIHA